MRQHWHSWGVSFNITFKMRVRFHQHILVTAIFVISVFGTTGGQLFEDEECHLNNEALGKCKTLHNCPVIKDSIANKVLPVVCSFNQSNVIVCCPEATASETVTQLTPNSAEDQPTTSTMLRMSTGSPCYTENGAAGECKSFRDCPEANTIASGVVPKLCYYEKSNPIVCCPRSTSRLPPRVQQNPQTNEQRRTTPVFTQRTTRRATTTSTIAPNPAEETNTAMCQHYGQFVFEMIQSPTLFINPHAYNESQCSSELRVNQLASRTASAVLHKEFPHVTALGYGEENNITWNCAGSLISENFILTAAACVTSPNSGRVRWARVGDMAPTLFSPSSRPIQRVAETFTPPWPRPRNSLALLKLERHVQFYGYIRPACLYSRPEKPSGYRFATTVGWGMANWDNGTTTTELMKKDLNFATSQNCKETRRGRRRRQRNQQSQNRIVENGGICVKLPPQSAISSCVGGLGSPLSIVLETPYCMHSILGVNTGGQTGCPTRNKPALFTRVSDHIEWIESVVWS